MVKCHRRMVVELLNCRSTELLLFIRDAVDTPQISRPRDEPEDSRNNPNEGDQNSYYVNAWAAWIRERNRFIFSVPLGMAGA